MSNKLEPAPLPNGGKGGLLKMATAKRTNLQTLEREAVLKRHELELAKLDEKHSSENAKATTVTPRKKA